MKICSCNEVIYMFADKDFVICPKCGNVMYIAKNESDCEKNETCPNGERPEGQISMGLRR